MIHLNIQIKLETMIKIMSLMQSAI